MNFNDEQIQVPYPVFPFMPPDQVIGGSKFPEIAVISSIGVGPAGPQGDKGDKGDTGAKGADGADGADGAPGTFGAITASVDDEVGTPSVVVTVTEVGAETSVDFAFHNLKGRDAGELPLMSANQRGGAKLGDGLAMSGEFLSVPIRLAYVEEQDGDTYISIVED